MQKRCVRVSQEIEQAERKRGGSHAEYTVEVTNNALDDESAWEDCTAAVKTGDNYIFEHKDAPTGTPAFNFRINVARGASGEGGYITSVQGGFQ